MRGFHAGASLGGIAFGFRSVFSPKRRTVRIVFTEAPKALSNNGADDALNPANWTIEAIEPSSGVKAWVEVVPVKVERVTDQPEALDVIVDLDFSFSIQYRITVSSSVVRASNPFSWTLEGTKEATFDPFDPACRMKTLPSMFDALGSAARMYDDAGDIERFAAIMQDFLEQFKALVDCFSDMIDPLFCSEEFLDARMSGLGNPFGFLTSKMNLTEKRRLAILLVQIYKKKGTRSGIKFVLEEVLRIPSVWVVSDNEQTWTLQDAESEYKNPTTDTIFFLGNGLYRPDGSGGVGYPTTYIDSAHPSNEDYTGNSFLGPGAVGYTQGTLGNGSISPPNHRQGVRLGKGWNLSIPGHIQPPYVPQEGFDVNTLTPEKNRRGYYNYRIFANAQLTDFQKQQITTLATYMQPAQAHLVDVIDLPETRKQGMLGISATLGSSFILS